MSMVLIVILYLIGKELFYLKRNKVMQYLLTKEEYENLVPKNKYEDILEN